MTEQVIFGGSCGTAQSGNVSNPNKGVAYVLIAIAVVIKVIIFRPIPPFIISPTVIVEAPKTIALGAVATY